MSRLLRPNCNQITGHLHCILLANVGQMNSACCMDVDTEGDEVTPSFNPHSLHAYAQVVAYGSDVVCDPGN